MQDASLVLSQIEQHPPIIARVFSHLLWKRVQNKKNAVESKVTRRWQAVSWSASDPGVVSVSWDKKERVFRLDIKSLDFGLPVFLAPQFTLGELDLDEEDRELLEKSSAGMYIKQMGIVALQTQPTALVEIREVSLPLHLYFPRFTSGELDCLKKRDQGFISLLKTHRLGAMLSASACLQVVLWFSDFSYKVDDDTVLRYVALPMLENNAAKLGCSSKDLFTCLAFIAVCDANAYGWLQAVVDRVSEEDNLERCEAFGELELEFHESEEQDETVLVAESEHDPLAVEAATGSQQHASKPSPRAEGLLDSATSVDFADSQQVAGSLQLAAESATKLHRSELELLEQEEGEAVIAAHIGPRASEDVEEPQEQADGESGSAKKRVAEADPQQLASEPSPQGDGSLDLANSVGAAQSLESATKKHRSEQPPLLNVEPSVRESGEAAIAPHAYTPCAVGPSVEDLEEPQQHSSSASSPPAAAGEPRMKKTCLSGAHAPVANGGRRGEWRAHEDSDTANRDLQVSDELSRLAAEPRKKKHRSGGTRDSLPVVGDIVRQRDSEDKRVVIAVDDDFYTVVSLDGEEAEWLHPLEVVPRKNNAKLYKAYEANTFEVEDVVKNFSDNQLAIIVRKEGDSQYLGVTDELLVVRIKSRGWTKVGDQEHGVPSALKKLISKPGSFVWSPQHRQLVKIASAVYVEGRVVQYRVLVAEDEEAEGLDATRPAVDLKTFFQDKSALERAIFLRRFPTDSGKNAAEEVKQTVATVLSDPRQELRHVVANMTIAHRQNGDVSESDRSMAGKAISAVMDLNDNYLSYLAALLHAKCRTRTEFIERWDDILGGRNCDGNVAGLIRDCVEALQSRKLNFQLKGRSAIKRVPLGRFIMENPLFINLPRQEWDTHREALETVVAIAGFDGMAFAADVQRELDAPN